jgi:hypothetical protein
VTNPTSNYSFVLPTSTDLVTDLPADFEVALQGVDTRLKALQPGTTLGDLAYSSATANTNTRLPIGSTGQVLTVAGGVPTWATGTTGDIEGVTAGTGISGGGTSGTVTVTNSMATAMTTKGDLVVATGSGTFVRQGVGADGTVLTADSAEADGVKWATLPAAGGFTLLSTTNITAAGTISVTSINQTYKHLFVTVNNFRPLTSGDIQLYLETSGASNISIGSIEIVWNGTSPLTSANMTGGGQGFIAKDVSQTAGVGTNSSSFWIYNYASTSLQKSITGSYGVYGVTNSNYRFGTFGGSTYSSTGLGAVSTLKIQTVSNTFAAQGTIQIYGVN